MRQHLDEAVEFGPYRLLPARRLLTRSGVQVQLGDRALEILCILVDQAPNLVSKKMLIEHVWPAQFVEEVNLRFQMRMLRKALGAGDRYISTVTGRGYCFVAQVVRPPMPARGVPSAESNLPQPLTNIVARERELAELHASLGHDRLVTVVGPGGVGKTRLAIELGWRVLVDYPAGVWLIDLAPVSDLGAAIRATATALSVSPPSFEKAIEAIAATVGTQPGLLIFDNCEHLVGAVAGLVKALLERAPRLTVLATSQEALGLSAEKTYHLHPLAVPPEDADDIAGFGAVVLFVRRASAADALFVLDGKNIAGVGEICRRLDGIPLALEMAAARLYLLGVDGLRTGLGERLRMLRGSPHGGEIRHDSLRAMVEWSYGLLDPTDQRLFRRLAVFPASFTLDAAVAVADDADCWERVDSLGRLVEKSLVAVERREPVRYRLLETLRLFAAEGLRESGEADAAADRHAGHVEACFSLAERDWETTPDNEWIARYRPEFDNLRASLDWALAAPERHQTALRLAASGGRLFSLLGQWYEGRQYLDRIIPLIDPATPPAIAGLVLLRAARMNVRLRDPAGLAYALRAAEIFRELDDRANLGETLSAVGAHYLFHGRNDDAMPVLHDSWDLLAKSNFKKSRLRIGNVLGMAKTFTGDYLAARRYLDEALDLARTLGSSSEGAVLINVAMAEYCAGNIARAVEFGREWMHRFRSGASPREIGLATLNLVAYLVAQASAEEARTYAQQAMTRGMTGDFPIVSALQVWAALSALEGRLEEAARLIGFVVAEREREGLPIQPSERRLYEELLHRLEAGLPASDLQAYRRQGALWSVTEACEFVSTRLLPAPAAP